jgi:hypothetical protein
MNNKKKKRVSREDKWESYTYVKVLSGHASEETK